MQQAAFGVFKKGQIILKESVTVPDESDVIVVFLNRQNNRTTKKKNELLEIFDTLGAWEDSKDTEIIIADIEKSRMSRKIDIVI